MWDVLGIAPTDDPKAIRRAYATRLKQVDPDRDRASFARLRQALEWGLARAAQPMRGAAKQQPTDVVRDLTERDPHRDAAPRIIPLEDLNRDVEVPVAPIAPTLRNQPPPAPPPVDETVLDRLLLVGLESALQQRDAREAARLYIRASATGAVPLGDAERMLARLFAVALADARFYPVEFRALAKTFGWDRPRLDAALVPHERQRVSARLAAEDWYDDLVAVAARRKRAPRKQVRAARLLAKGVRGWGLFRVDRPSLRAFLDEYARHEAWLHDRIDPAWVAMLKARIRRRDLFAGMSIVIVLGALLLNAAIVLVGTAVGRLENDSSVGFFVVIPIAAILIWFIRLLLCHIADVWRNRP